MPKFRYQPLGPLLPGKTTSRAVLALQIPEDNPREARPVVLVWLPDEATGDKELVATVKKETARAAILEHPNIIRVHGFSEQPEGEARVVEYADGENLRTLLKLAGKLPAKMAALIACDAATGLHYAHLAGNDDGTPLVHADIRPETLLVSYSGITKVAGYGALAVAPREPGGRRVEGRRHHCSPEQVVGGRDAFHVQTDVYLLGVVLHECLTGKVPFEGELDFDHAVLSQPVPDLPAELCPPALAEVIKKAMAKKAVDRYPSAFAMREAILAAVVELPSHLELARFLTTYFPEDQQARAHRRALIERGLALLPPKPPSDATLPPPEAPPVPAPVAAAPPPSVPPLSTPSAPAPGPELPVAPAAVTVATSAPAATSPATAAPSAPGAASGTTIPTAAASSTAAAPSTGTASSTGVGQSTGATPSTGVAAVAPSSPAPVPSAAPAVPTPSTAVTVPPAVPPGMTSAAFAPRAERKSGSAVGGIVAGVVALIALSIFALSRGGTERLPTQAAAAADAGGTQVLATTPLPAADAGALAVAPGAPDGSVLASSTGAQDAGPPELASLIEDAGPEHRPATAGLPTGVTLDGGAPALFVFVEPAVDLVINGKQLGRTPVTVPISPGRKVLKLTDKARNIATTRVVIVADKGTTTSRIYLQRGYVNVVAPPGATIFLDGRKIGVAPQRELGVYEGPHELVVLVKGARWQKQFETRPNQHLRFEVTFQ